MTGELSQPPPRRRRSSVLIAALVIATGIFANVQAGYAAVGTDQEDYWPGSVVTISGDNSDGAGYLPGETVRVDVTGPNGYAASCDGTADAAGAWSCTVTLNSDDSAVGSYDYTAVGQDSGVSQSGTFTDAIPFTSIAVTLNGVAQGSSSSSSSPGVPITVAPGATITATVSASVVTGGAPAQWRSTGWKIGGSNTGKLATCSDTPDVSSGNSPGGPFNLTTITAPTTPGAHDVHFALDQDDGTGTNACGGGGAADVRKTYTGAIVVAANQPPTTPGKPGLAAGSSTPNQGVFDLTWAASTDPESNPITYRLEHSDANDGGVYSLVPGAGSLGSNSFSFTAAAKESEGTWTYKVRASDGALNSSFSPVSDAIKVDPKPPTAPNASPDRSPEDSSGNWFLNTVTVSYSGSTDPNLADGSAGSGVASHSASQTFNTSGTHNYSGTATDNAGNESNATTGQVKVDATDPQVQITSGCPSGLVARNSTQNINVSASDAHSGLATNPSGSVALDTSTPGEHTKTVTAVDKVGRSQSASCTYTVNSPPTKPGTPQASTTPNKGAFTVSWDASTDPDDNLDHYLLQHRDADDAGYSTVANVAASSTPSHEFTTGSPEAEGTWNYRVIAVDGLNESSPESDESGSVKVDRTPPSPPKATTTPASPYFGPWFKNSVTVGYSGPSVPNQPDDPNLPDGSSGSGVASYSSSQTFNTSGTHNYSGKATDNAGNESAATTGEVKVDATNPTVGISGCPTGNVLLGSSQSLTVSASDDHSGLKSDPSGTVALDTDSVGQHTQTVTATDNVDHSANASCTYSVVYDWHGFFQPIDNPPTYNSAKAGSAIPVKFSLTGYQGLDIFETGYPRSAKCSCSTTGYTDSIEETVTAGNSTLKYDPGSDQYHYVWKTERSWAGTCRKLEVKLDDGTVHTAYFTFK